MENLILKKKGEASWITWIKKRIKKNLNFLALFSGPTGIGKSWSAISVACQIDPEFNPNEQVAFDFRGLMRAINKFNDKGHELSKRKYKLIVFDESQTDLGNREWQSKVNKLFNYLLSTFRHQNIILLFTSPYSDFIDSASMKLIHCNFECKGWSSKTKSSLVRPKILQYNSKKKKFYEHSLHTIVKQNVGPARVNKIVHWKIKSPPKDVVELYEIDKATFTNKLNARITNELEEMGKKEEDKKDLTRKDLTKRQEEVMKVLASTKNYEEASKILGISGPAISVHKKLARKKGYKVDEFWEN